MAKKTTKTKRSDVTDEDEMWCLIKAGGKQRFAKALAEQCSHAKAPGQYVVQSGRAWCIFDPPTKMQALSWVNGRPERERRIHWLCHECGEIMPLATYTGVPLHVVTE